MKVFDNRDIATVFNRHFLHVEDLLHLSAVCRTTHSQRWSQRMSEKYDMAARIRARFGLIVCADDAFTEFRVLVLKGTWCLGGCGQERDYFVSAKLAYQGRCCDVCFHTRIADGTIHAFYWGDDTKAPNVVVETLRDCIFYYVFWRLVGVGRAGWTADDMEEFMAFCGVNQYYSESFVLALLKKVAVPVLSQKWVRKETLLLEVKQSLQQVDVVEQYYKWSGEERPKVFVI